MAFLIEQFRDSGLADPGNPTHGLDLAALATRYVEHYARYKSDKKIRAATSTSRRFPA